MKKEKQHIPSGYKPSPLGIIPEDWEVKRLGEVCTRITDGTHGTPQKQQSGVPYLTAIHIKDGVIDYENCYYLTEEDHRDIYQRCNPEYGDVLMVNIGAGVGAVAMNKVEYEFSLKNVALLKPNKRILTGYFLETYLLSSKKKNLHKLINGGAQPFWGLDDIAKIHILLPSLAEQSKFENVIRLWDTAIEKQTQLVEKLTLRKRGLMQQLLTGKKRLKGFSGEWKEVRLSEIGVAYGGLVNKNKEDFENGNALFITYMNVFSNGKIDINNLGQVRILPSEKQEQVQYGDIFFTVSSETPDEVGMASVLLDDVQNTYLNSFCFGYRLNDFKTIVPVYASYLFRVDAFRKEMYKIAQGSTRFNISKTEVLNMRIIIPSIEEQTAIASVLINADKEIDLANKKLARLQEEKNGLMQVLLTGKKRII